MPIIQYQEHKLSPEVSVVLSEISSYSLTAKSMLTALGDYWTNFYRTLDPISMAASGSVASISKEYTRFLDMVLASNILDIPLKQSSQFELLVLNRKDLQTVYTKTGEIDYFFIEIPEIVDTEFLTTSLFESRVVLQKGVHFDVVLNQGYKFYVDLFDDIGITNYSYAVGEETEKQILLWACDIAFNSTIIYERFGRFLYKKSIDSERYKWLVTALMRFYENAKSVKCIQDILNVMYGLPYTRYENEVIKEIYYVDSNLSRLSSETEDPYICIETDKAKYYAFSFSTIKFTVGDVVPQFSLLADFNTVDDYISKPKWWEDCEFPVKLADNANILTKEQQNELMDKVLKYNTVHISLGVSFETYATYLSQVNQVFEIIESGFPVYLYPLVDTFFRAVFIDKFDILDELLMSAKTALSTHYDWGSYYKFDGTIPYHMYPEQDFGESSETQPITFNGTKPYTPPLSFTGEQINAPKHNGKTSYTQNCKYNFDNDREYLVINQYGYKVEEKYERNSKVTVQGLQYNGTIVPDGSHTFGEVITKTEDEFLYVNAKQKELTDTLTNVSDKVNTFIKPNFVNGINNGTFSGTLQYGSNIPENVEDKLETHVRTEVSDTYIRNKFEVKNCIKYNGTIFPDGSHTFGECTQTEKEDILDVRVTPEPFSDVETIENSTNIIINSKNLSSLSALFNGSIKYSEPNKCKSAETKLKTTIKIELSDAAAKAIPLQYGSVIPDGTHLFGDTISELFTDKLKINSNVVYSDKINNKDRTFIVLKNNNRECFNSVLFNGTFTYGNVPEINCIKEKLNIYVKKA